MRALEPQATVRVPTLGAWRPGAKVGINYQRTYRSATPSRIYKRTIFTNGGVTPFRFLSDRLASTWPEALPHAESNRAAQQKADGTLLQ